MRRTEPCNLCPPESWVDRPAPDRPGYLVTHCQRCGRCLGYRPVVTKGKRPDAEPRGVLANQYYLGGM